MNLLSNEGTKEWQLSLMNKAKYKQRAESMKRNCSGLEKLTKDSLKTTEKVQFEGKAAHQFKQTKFIFKAKQICSTQPCCSLSQFLSIHVHRKYTVKLNRIYNFSNMNLSLAYLI